MGDNRVVEIIWDLARTDLEISITIAIIICNSESGSNIQFKNTSDGQYMKSDLYHCEHLHTAITVFWARNHAKNSKRQFTGRKAGDFWS